MKDCLPETCTCLVHSSGIHSSFSHHLISHSLQLLYLPTYTAAALLSTPHPNLRLDTTCTPTPDYPTGTTSHSSKSLLPTERTCHPAITPTSIWRILTNPTSKAKSLIIARAMIHGSHQWTATVKSNYADSQTSWPLPRTLSGLLGRRPQLQMPSLR